jgi:cytochrome c oxidase subunit 2
MDGQKLFLAKGCVVCHVHNRAIAQSERYGVEFGPNLTDFSADPGYLKRFLADPAATKPGVEMPNLGLSQAEIDALVEFINESG